jgi:hypothetical protein
MAASVDAAAMPVAPAFEESGDAVEQARTLIGALNLLSRNLPLPPAVLRAVSSIYHDGGAVEAVVEVDADKGGDEEMAVADGAGKGNTAADGAAEVRAVGSSVCVANFHSAWVFRGCVLDRRCNVEGCDLAGDLIRVCGIEEVQLGFWMVLLY